MKLYTSSLPTNMVVHEMKEDKSWGQAYIQGRGLEESDNCYYLWSIDMGYPLTRFLDINGFSRK